MEKRFFESMTLENVFLAECSIPLPPRKRQKTKDFLTFSGGIEIKNWGKMY